MQKTIYIPSDLIWDSIQAQASREDRSVSSYLVRLHRIYTPDDQHRKGSVDAISTDSVDMPGTDDLGEAYSESNPPPETVEAPGDGYTGNPIPPGDGSVGGKPDTVKSKAIERGKANLDNSDHVSKMSADLKVAKGKKKSKSLSSGCDECKSPFGHRPACLRRVK